ncbi:MAG: hypothetical protein ACI970_001367 [Myxococcota bacterium]|jgi:hypothetical protein
MDAMSGRVRLASFGSRPLAELARGFLEEHEVDAVVAADDGNGTQPEVGFVTGGAWVLVAPHDLDRARGLLDEVAGDGGSVVALRHGTRARAVAGALAATMAVLGVWTTVVLLLF